MDYEGILSTVLFLATLILLPAAAALTYFVLLLHQYVRNQERYGELCKRKGRREERLRRTAEAKRLADPFFHFNVKSGKSVDDVVQEQLARERGHAPSRQRNDVKDQKIAKAIEGGRLILLDTELGQCAPGMVVGREIAEHGLFRGDELTRESLDKLAAAGVTMLPVLYNPGRVAGAMAGAAA